MQQKFEGPLRPPQWPSGPFNGESVNIDFLKQQNESIFYSFGGLTPLQQLPSIHSLEAGPSSELRPISVLPSFMGIADPAARPLEEQEQYGRNIPID